MRLVVTKCGDRDPEVDRCYSSIIFRMSVFVKAKTLCITVTENNFIIDLMFKVSNKEILYKLESIFWVNILRETDISKQKCIISIRELLRKGKKTRH